MKPIAIEKFSHCRVLVVGDIMLDAYLWGDVSRISPEAPVPVVRVYHEEKTLGGAGNVVRNLTQLGANVSMVAVCGADERGKRIKEELLGASVNIEGLLMMPHRHTTHKSRVFAQSQHVLRFDRETILPPDEATLSQLKAIISNKISSFDVVIVSDYGKGLLTNALLEHIMTIAQKNSVPVLVDPKGSDFSKYKGASILTPNRKEAAEAAYMSVETIDDVYAAGQKLMDVVKSNQFLITCGSDGMVLFERNKPPHHIETKARQVYEVSGAGDTVISVLGLCVGIGADWHTAAEYANSAAGVVVGKMGTATLTPQELVSAHAQKTTTVRKFISASDLPAMLADLKRQNKQIVFTNGCFDLLHAGHIAFLAESKKLGDILIVALNDDASVHALKGAGRPILSQDERINIMSALDSVDYVLLFSENELEALIRQTSPHVLTKGGNYDITEVVGNDFVTASGGNVVCLPLVGEGSTSAIIRDIQQKGGETPSSG